MGRGAFPKGATVALGAPDGHADVNQAGNAEWPRPLMLYGECAKLRAMAKRESRMLTVREAAEKIGAGESSVRLWASQGKFPGARQEETPFGSYWLIPESSLAGFSNPGRGRPRKQAEHASTPPRGRRPKQKGEVKK